MSLADIKAAAETEPGVRSRAGRLRRVFAARESGVLTALVALCVVGTVATPGFLAPGNLLNVGQQISQIGIMAVGMTFVIICAEIDLSVGSIYALGAVLAGLAIERGEPISVAMLLGLAVGFAAGLINGVAIIYMRIPSFIVTLGTLSAFRGAALLITNGAPISLNTNLPLVRSFSLLGQGLLFGVVPMQFVFMALVFAIGIVLLGWTRYGFHVYAVGGSAEAARLCGVNLVRVRLASFVLAGVTSAFAGVLGLSFLDYVQGVTGDGLELLVIAAVIVGGCNLFGGSGTMWGTLVGVALIGVLQNILVLSGLSSFWQIFAIGVVIVLAVWVDGWVRRRS